MDESLNAWKLSGLRPGGGRVSLRTKGIIAYVTLVLYVVLLGIVVAGQRESLRVTVEKQKGVYAVEESLARLNSALAFAILRVSDESVGLDARAAAEAVTLDVEAVQAGLQEIRERHPAVQPWIVRLERNVTRVRSDWSVESQVEMRDSLHELVAQLDEITRRVREEQSALSAHFGRIYDTITLTALGMGLLGVIVFGSVVTLFFTRLVDDISKLQRRAGEIVAGSSPSPAAVRRRDELGALGDSIERMQTELRERARQLEIVRQQRFHHEKMSAVGSLAAAIAHEVNNPIAAITGVAEAIREKQSTDLACGRHCRPDLILAQTQRISQITRQLAEMTAPQPPEPQLLDVNALVRGTCGFVRFDRRFRDVRLELDLDPQVPALTAVADHLTQVLMNLLINAADATAGAYGREPRIDVQTRLNGRTIDLFVSDNGCGMEAQTLAHAFDEAFSTKPRGKGSGLGLHLSRSLIETMGGGIDLESESGRGTRAALHLPCPAGKG